MIVELRRASATGGEAGAGAERKSVAGMLRRSFGGGARRDDLREALTDDSASDMGEQLTRTNSAGAALARGFSGMRTTLGRTLSGGAGVVQVGPLSKYVCRFDLVQSDILLWCRSSPARSACATSPWPSPSPWPVATASAGSAIQTHGILFALILTV